MWVGNSSQWWRSLSSHSETFGANWYFHPIVTWHLWAVLVIWQHALSCFAYFHEGVWMVCKDAGADERLYPWFPQQNTVSVVSWSLLFTPIDAIWGLWPFCECTTEAFCTWQTQDLQYTASKHRRVFKRFCFTFWYMVSMIICMFMYYAFWTQQH